jgi:uncharacterized membrane protein HdeD (DUF308 family)
MTMGDALPVQVPHELAQHWGWFLAFGIGLLVLGVLAIARSVTATVATMLFFGWLLVLLSHKAAASEAYLPGTNLL